MSGLRGVPDHAEGRRSDTGGAFDGPPMGIEAWLAHAHSESTANRLTAVMRLCFPGVLHLRRSNRVRRVLVGLLGDSERRVRYGAALALWHVRAPGAVTVLLEILGSGDDPRLEGILLCALGHQGSVCAVPQILDYLAKRCGLPQDQAVAIRALGRIGDARSLPSARELAMSEDPALREAAGTALQMLGDPLGREVLCAYYSDPDVRRAKENQWAALPPLLKRQERRCFRRLAMRYLA